MSRFITFSFVIMMVMTTKVVLSQSITIVSANGNSEIVDLSSIESIIYENNNLVFKTADCGDNYFNVIVNEKLFFAEASTIGEVETFDNSTLFIPIQLII